MDIVPDLRKVLDIEAVNEGYALPVQGRTYGIGDRRTQTQDNRVIVGILWIYEIDYVVGNLTVVSDLMDPLDLETLALLEKVDLVEIGTVEILIETVEEVHTDHGDLLPSEER